MSESRTLIIAEAGVNHNGSIDRALLLVDAAAEAGADFVKFQTFKAEKLVSKSAKMAQYQIDNLDGKATSQFEMIKKLELDESAHRTLIEHCAKKGIAFLTTSFDEESFEFVSTLSLKVFKIPSGEITNLPYLRKVSKLTIPVILSTGMCDLSDIESALSVLLSSGMKRSNITILHCNTEYPTPLRDVNLRAMNTIQSAFDVKVGYSDHTLGIEVPIAAVARGASCIEKHFTLDRTLEGPDHKASLEPDELKSMVQGIRNIEMALGSTLKLPTTSEQKNIPIARKSIHIATDLPEGHVLTALDLVMRRPGDGISPMKIDSLLGKKLQSFIEEGTKLSEKHFH